MMIKRRLVAAIRCIQSQRRPVYLSVCLSVSDLGLSWQRPEQRDHRNANEILK